MSEVQELFQDTRTIKNMLRDVSEALVERGINSSVYEQQIHFLFEDIRNITLATPFFNSMRTEMSYGELKVELWTIRNTLRSLYFLNNLARKYILRDNAKLHVSKQDLLNKIYALFSSDIVDPEGITDIIYTKDDDDYEDDDDNDDDDDDDDSRVTTASFIFAQKSYDDDKDDDGSDDDEMLEMKNRIALERMELFLKGNITASAVRDEVSSIFDKIQSRRTNKINIPAIDHYRRNGLKTVRLLQNDEASLYILQQLSRYLCFHPKNMKEQCSVDLLKEIFYNTLTFGNDYEIDDEMIPKLVKKDAYIEQLYNHLHDLYNNTCKNKFNSIIIEQTLEYMTLEDVLSMIMIYQQMFSALNREMNDGDTFVVTHDAFCSFVDAKGFDPDKNKNEWTNKTTAASDLFLSVFDAQENLVTLGQIRQTIVKLIRDVTAMKCGQLTRIINHLNKQLKEDTTRCAQDRVKYVEWIKNKMEEKNELTTQLTMSDDDDVEASGDGSRINSKQKTMQNPGLAFNHISQNKWVNFIDGIGCNFQMNVSSTKISSTLDEHKELLEEHQEKQIIESILDNTTFDIIKIQTENNNIAEDNKIEEKYENKDIERKESKKKSLGKKQRRKVFDTTLSFCAERITLQQLFLFSKRFRTFLRKNDTVNEMLCQYDKIINEHSTESKRRFSESELLETRVEIKMKQRKIPLYFEGFKREYFGDVEVKQYNEEVNYLFLRCENVYDLCHRIYPFWSGSLNQDIMIFMESTEQIQGNYELKKEEFGQLKHSLNVSDDFLAVKLFHIIRFKIR
eukprot:334238_1